MGEAHHRDAGAREAPAASGGEVGALPVADRVPCGDVPCSPGSRDIPKPLSLILFSLCHRRLELLLQIANKIQNGALSCEEKLTLAKNTLQAVSGGCYFPPANFLFIYFVFLPLLLCPSLPLSSVWVGGFPWTAFLSFLTLSLYQRGYRGGGGYLVIYGTRTLGTGGQGNSLAVQQAALGDAASEAGRLQRCWLRGELQFWESLLYNEA